VDCRENRGDSGRIHRSYLFLSTILLLWNLAAYSVHVARNAIQATPSGAGMHATDRSLGKTGTGNPPAASARAGPMSARQKYLLGKRVDINKASAMDLEGLPGISPATAAAVVAERKRIGRFRSPEDLLRVKGIKWKRLKKILPFLATMENN
jgi:competence ComEA-like helix-hairpin-helix protein